MFRGLLAIALMAAAVAQASVVVDVGFGSNGETLLPLDLQTVDYLPQIAVTNDHRVVLASGLRSPALPGILLQQLNSAGAADTRFGAGDGRIVVPFVSAQAGVSVADLQIQPDGDLLVLSATSFDPSGVLGSLVLTRHNADGSLDAGFNGGAPLPIALSADNVGQSKLIQQGGGALVLVLNSDETFPPYVAVPRVTRVRADGQIDAAFAAGGTLVLPVAGRDYAVDAMPLPSGGFQLLYRRSPSPDNPVRNWWRRFHADGSLDVSFGSGGDQEIALATPNPIASLVALPDGRYLGIDLGKCAVRLFDSQGGSLRSFSACHYPNARSNFVAVPYGDKLLFSGFRDNFLLGPEDGTYLRVADTAGDIDHGFGNDGTGFWRPQNYRERFVVAADGAAQFVMVRQDYARGGFAVSRYQERRGAAPPTPVPALGVKMALLLGLSLFALAWRRARAGQSSRRAV